MAQTVSYHKSLGFNLRAVEKMTLGQALLCVHWLHLLSTILPMLHIHISCTYHQRYTILATDSKIQLEETQYLTRILRDFRYLTYKIFK